MGALKCKGLAAIITFLLAIILISPVAGADKTATEYIMEGKEFLKATNFDKAIASFAAALKLEPNSVQALLLRGNAYTRKEYFDKAIEDYTAVIRLDPKNGKAYNNRAIAYWFNDEAVPARDDMMKAEELGITANKEIWRALQASPVITPVTPAEDQPSVENGMPPATGQEKPKPQ
jgi:Flp pilus assembly protein TadD